MLLDNHWTADSYRHGHEANVTTGEMPICWLDVEKAIDRLFEVSTDWDRVPFSEIMPLIADARGHLNETIQAYAEGYNG